MLVLMTTSGGQTANAKEIPMRHKQVSPLTVVGISVRTNNAREAGPDGLIPKQWGRFYQGRILEKIPHKDGTEIYAVYTDYASDHNGEYTFVIGAMVKQGTTPPPGMVAVNIPGGSYAVVSSDRGPLPQVIPAAWQRVFQLENDGTLHRAYKADFELYDQRSANPGDAQVDIYLGVK